MNIQKQTDPVRRITKTRRGQKVTAYDSREIGYVRFSLVSRTGETVYCENMHPESKPFRFGMYEEGEL